jgi:hypothetical protein
VIDTEYSTDRTKKYPEEDNYLETLEVGWIKLCNYRITSCGSFLLRNTPDDGIHRITQECVDSDSTNITAYYAGRWMLDSMSDREIVYVNGLKYDLRALCIEPNETKNWLEAKEIFGYNHLADLLNRESVPYDKEQLHQAIYCSMTLAQAIMRYWKRQPAVVIQPQYVIDLSHIPAWMEY